jgi:transmembrane sensor
VFLEGQAYFAVRHNGRVPFQVFTEGGEVTVLGTRFDVSARGEDFQVLVVEGQVEVQAQGQRVSVGASEMVISDGSLGTTVREVENVYSATSWIGDFIVFGSTPLESVAREFEERFGIRVHVADSTIAARTVTGWFRDRSPMETLESICYVANAQCVVADGEVRIEAVLPAPVRVPPGQSP